LTKTIKIKDLTVKIDGKDILSNINLSINSGEVAAVTGPTGSGKSTLLKIIAGIIPYLYHSFRVSGYVNVCGLSPLDATKKGLVAYIPQDPSTYFIGSTVGEELLLTGTLDSARINSIVSDLIDMSSRKTYELSDGQLYKLLLASAVGSGTKVLLLDEPTSHVDPWSLRNILELLKKYCASSGASAIIVDHRLELIRDFVDCVLELRGSRHNCVPTLKRFRGLRRSNEVLVSVNEACFTYGDSSYIFEGVNLEVRSSESIAIIGRNGAGKTTLIKLLAGVLKPASGSVSIAKPVFMVPQTPIYWFSRDTVRDEILFYAKVWGFRGDIDSVLELFRLSDVSYLSPYSLSVGEARRLSLALAYVSRAKVLLLDEPTLGLDEESKKLLIELIHKFCVGGSAVITATHDTDLIKYFSRTYILNNGVLEVVHNGSALVA